jgi:hypothetical protein
MTAMKKCMEEQENAHSQIRKRSTCVLSEKQCTLLNDNVQLNMEALRNDT